MQGKTHKQGGMLISILGYAYLRQKGLLLPDMNEGLQWLIMYPFCMWGSVASDLDHHWDSCPQKDYPSWMVNKILHITAPIKKTLDKTMSEEQKRHSLVYKVADTFNASHRSWQTHSDLTIWILFYIMNLVLHSSNLSLGVIDVAVLRLVITGLGFGITAHFILDMLTPEGIWIMPLVWLNALLQKINPKIKIPRKLHFVPYTKNKFFATGNGWEQLVQKLLKVFTVISLLWFVWTLLQPYIPYTIDMSNLIFQ